MKLGALGASEDTPSWARQPALPYFFALGLLAVVNAVIFPLWLGFAGGATPLTGIRIVIWHVALAAANAAVLFFVVRNRAGGASLQLGSLLLLAALTRLSYLAVRVWLGASVVDPDIQLFFRYAQEFASGRYPTMEYPQVALLAYYAAYLASAGETARFAVVLPLFNLAIDLIALASFQGLAHIHGVWEKARVLLALYALSPFTLVLWYGKYDAIPAGLLALGIYLFASRHYYMSSFALAAGFLAKWLPGIAIPFFAIYLLRSGRRLAALGYVATTVGVVALAFAATWLIAPERIADPYRFHGERGLMGESALYVLVYLFEPTTRLAYGTSPWSGVDSGLVTNERAALIQFLGVGLVLIAAAITRPRPGAAIAFASVAVAIFIILNRVFSPQYLLLLNTAYIGGLIAVRPSRRTLGWVTVCLLSMTLLNYLVWPLWTSFWVAASALFFALNLLVTLSVAYLALRAR